MKKKKPICPHCGKEMKMWETPPFNFSDGLGWGSEFLYVCLNDECPLYVEGWASMMEHYGQVASYRCICDPISGKNECIPVFTSNALKGNTIDEQEAAAEKARKEAEDKMLADLLTYRDEKDADTILKIVLNEKESVRIRTTAATYLGELGDINCIEPMRNHSFSAPEVRESVDHAIEMIHKANFTKECPYCAEIIKARAKVCKHCNRDL